MYVYHINYSNKATNEIVQPSYFTVFQYVIAKNYAFFAANVLLITIAVTLFLFFVYHLTLVYQNNTTNENIKRGRMQKYMNLIKTTLERLMLEREIKYDDSYKAMKLSDDEIKRYKDIAFKRIYFC